MKWEIAKGKELRIAVSGKSGCGNTTVSRILADTLNIAVINFTFRNLSEETGLTLAQIIEKAKTDDYFDNAVDTRQVELARRHSCVLGSRLAVWMLPEADFKVYLTAEEDVRVKRIQSREGGSFAEIKKFTHMRDDEDSKRYKRMYGIDNDDYSNVDLVIDTAKYTPEQISEKILNALKEKGLVFCSDD